MKGSILKSFALLLVFVGASITMQAQDVLDGAYEDVTSEERTIIEYDHIRQADVFWRKRIWRIIDVREKMNLSFSYPKRPLIQIIHEAAKNEELTVYDPAVDYADEFKQVLPPETVKGIGQSRDTVLSIDPITMEQVELVEERKLSWEQIVKYRIKEDWIFDEGTSSFKVRILGIAPILEDRAPDGSIRGDMTMYWIYFPDLRPILVKEDVFNPRNDEVSMNWDQIFHDRYFSSYIYKESNVFDRFIQEYATGLDALMESERIKREMFNFEHDLWTY